MNSNRLRNATCHSTTNSRSRQEVHPSRSVGRAAGCSIRLWVLCLCALLAGAAQAHGYSAGDVGIGHPYATPSVPGATTGAAYIATLQNTGDRPDRLLRASTPVAARVELHSMQTNAGGVMRMREVKDIPLATTESIKMRPGQGVHFMLIDLKQALKEGDTFPMTMEFEHGGTVIVKVVVQVPKVRAEEPAGHHH
jgi:periplasmic copper chaperone A